MSNYLPEQADYNKYSGHNIQRKLNFIYMTRHNNPPSILGTFESTIENQVVAYSVKRSYRARCVRLERMKAIRPYQFYSALFYSYSDVPELLQSKGKWILNKLAELNPSNIYLQQAEVCDTFPYLGKQLKVKICHSPEAADDIILKNSVLTLSYRKGIITPERLIGEWYRKQALASSRIRLTNIVPSSAPGITVDDSQYQDPLGKLSENES